MRNRSCIEIPTNNFPDPCHLSVPSGKRFPSLKTQLSAPLIIFISVFQYIWESLGEPLTHLDPGVTALLKCNSSALARMGDMPSYTYSCSREAQ